MHLLDFLHVVHLNVSDLEGEFLAIKDVIIYELKLIVCS